MNAQTDKIIELVKRDPVRVEALELVYQLNLPQGYIAAGFVRNLVWDWLHGKETSTALNDVDVIYFDNDEAHSDGYLIHEQHLNQKMPSLNWQVRNQALMHHRNHDPSYLSTQDAMSYWPEKETAVAMRKVSANRYECISAFGFESLFNGCISHNPKRAHHVFLERIATKAWLVHWPRLQVEGASHQTNN